MSMIVFGKQSFEYVLQNAPQLIQEVYLAKELKSDFFKKIKRLQIPILRIDTKKAQGLARGKNHQGVLAKVTDIEITPLESFLQLQSLVILCGLSDIGNIGSIVRTCYALGVDGVMLCDRNTLHTNVLEGIFRTSSGAMLHLPFGFYSSSLDVVNILKTYHFTLFGAGVLKTQKHNVCINNTQNPMQKWALFVGREDVGLSNRLLSKMDNRLYIPMCHGFDSLNVSVATGILIDRIQHNILKKG